ncbi:MAG: 4'-phosphopantetheinyl transferase family protein [Phycisphaerae bacterium]
MTLPAPWQPMPGNLVAGRDEIHLFLAGANLPLDVFESLSAFLTTQEREQFLKFKMPQKRVEAVLSRAMLRERLSHFTGIAPQQLPITYNPHGKPSVEGSNVHFNISHTAGYILLGIGRDHELGVDIESPRQNLEHENLARRFFTPGEHAALLAIPAENRVNAFFRCWTRKEAILKAMGRGISAGLDTFEVPLHPAFAPMQVHPWILHDLPVPNTHIAALATQCPHVRLHFWAWQAAPAG